MAQREGKFNLAIAAIRVMTAFVAGPISPNDIAIWTRADRLAARAKPLIELRALHKILKSDMRAHWWLWVCFKRNIRRFGSASG